MAECRRRRDVLQDVADEAYMQVFQETPAPRVQAFGSQAQGMATDTSDWDFAMEIPEARASHAKVLRAAIRQILIDRKLTKYWKSEDQSAKSTLLWTVTNDSVTTSLLVDQKENMTFALSTTAFLAKFYRTHSSMKDHVKAVATLLRSQKHMAVKGTVGDSLKTASLFFLCAALIEHGATSAQDLYRGIALLRFNDQGLSVDLQHHKIDWLPREGRNLSDAVVILQKIASSTLNSAKRVSDPRLACIQCACYTAAGLGGHLLASVPRWDDFDFSTIPWQTRHLVVKDPALPVVTTIWQTRQMSDKIQVLIILTGNGNDRCFPSVSGYAYVIVVTWAGTHADQHAWMPAYLAQLRDVVADRIPAGRLDAIDVLGLSRGHGVLMECCMTNRNQINVRLAAQFRHFMAAGGCIWQLEYGVVNENIATKICAGIDQMNTARGGTPIFRFVTISKMDSATLFAGDVHCYKTRTKNTVARVHYVNHARQLADRVHDLRILNFQSHMETLKQALVWASHLAEHGTLPLTSADVVHSALFDALTSYPTHDVQRSANADASVATRALADARTTLFRSCRRRWRSTPAPPPDTELGHSILDEIRSHPICIVTGEPGTGKTKDMPIALLGSLLAGSRQPQGCYYYYYSTTIVTTTITITTTIATTTSTIISRHCCDYGDQGNPEYPTRLRTQGTAGHG